MKPLRPHPPLDHSDPSGPCSTLYGDVFRTKYGGWDEAREVFVDGTLASSRWQRAAPFAILELGFGLGINFLATWERWRNDASACRQLNYVALELHPVTRDDLLRALRQQPAPPELRDTLVALWPLPLPGLHRLRFEGGRLTLTLGFGSAAELLPQLRMRADAIYLDGFAPARNPAMWEPGLLKGLARLANPGATVSTYTSAGIVRGGLQQAGFATELLPGAGGKRHRLFARYAPRWSLPEPVVPVIQPPEQVLVIGAGLVGAAIAAGLRARGLAVVLAEQQADVGQAGSAQPWCAAHVHLSADDNVLARLSRSALLLQNTGAVFDGTGLQAQHAPQPDPVVGKLLIARDEADQAAHAAMLERLDFPQGFVCRMEADQASDLAGVKLTRNALWLPHAGAFATRPLLQRWLQDPAIDLRLATRVERLEHDGDRWRALDPQGRVIATARAVVLANAAQALAIAGLSLPTLSLVGGQSTTVAHAGLGPLRVVLGGHAHVIPVGQARVLVGATYADGASTVPTAAADADNLERLQRMIARPGLAFASAVLHQHVGTRVVSPDRLPLIGPCPDETRIRQLEAALGRNDRLPYPELPGLYMASAMGSRGLLWATLAAEVLASQMLGEPAPLENDLLEALSPARFWRRLLRRSQMPTASIESGPLDPLQVR